MRLDDATRRNNSDELDARLEAINPHKRFHERRNFSGIICAHPAHPCIKN